MTDHLFTDEIELEAQSLFATEAAIGDPDAAWWQVKASVVMAWEKLGYHGRMIYRKRAYAARGRPT